MFFSPGYLLLFLVTAVILGAASAHIRSTYRRWSGVRNATGLTGHQVARQILDSQGLQHIGIAIIGLGLFAMILVFHVVPFPVEFDASRRAMSLLRENGIVTDQDIGGARKVLTAAALTYVAAIAVSALQVGFWALQVFGRR